MAAEEDKKFEAVLGGFLVNRLRAGNVHCPDSDVLAAYHERSLLAEEMNSWKEHIVGCTRCQAVLAELAATDAIRVPAPEEASQKEEALLPESGESVAVAGEERKPAKFPKKSRPTPFFRGVRWQWLAPAGALAAGLLVWVAWHENQPRPWKTPAETAKRESPSTSAAPRPATPQAAVTPESHQAQTDQLASFPKDQGAVRGELSAEGTRIPEALKQLEKPEAGVRSAPARPLANKERGAPEGAANGLVARGPAENQPAGEPKTGLARAAADTVEVPTETANAQMQTQQSQVGAPESAGPRSLRETEVQKSKAESPPLTLHTAVPAPPSPTFGEDRVSHALMARSSNLSLIVTPNKKILWRVGHAGMIEFSSDGGASWSRQTSNVLVDLTAGSAPAEKVCWIVGRAGTILRTTDAGAHWGILPSPLEEDLGGVRSTDALHAIVWNLGNTKVFETADGGVTWKPAASP